MGAEAQVDAGRALVFVLKRLLEVATTLREHRPQCDFVAFGGHGRDAVEPEADVYQLGDAQQCGPLLDRKEAGPSAIVDFRGLD